MMEFLGKALVWGFLGTVTTFMVVALTWAAVVLIASMWKHGKL